MTRQVLMLGVGCWVLGVGCAHAQKNKRPEAVDMDSPTFVPTVKVGKVLEGGDSIQYMEMNNVYVFPPVEFSSKRQAQAYTRLVKNVKTVLPIAKEANMIMMETAEYLETLPSKKAKEEHMKRVEKSIMQEYKPRMKKLTYSQGKLLIKPSKTAVKSFLANVRGIIKRNKATKQETLIYKLNPVIRGWVNNQRYVVSSEIFSKVDYEIYKCLWQWANRRHDKKKGHKWVASRYWHNIGNRKWTFSALTKNRDGDSYYAKLEYATDTKIIRFRKIVAAANPFDEKWTAYFEEREGEKMLNSTKGRDKLLSIWQRQNRRCPVCGGLITSETGFKIQTQADRRYSKSMVHPECRIERQRPVTNFEPGSR